MFCVGIEFPLTGAVRRRAAGRCMLSRQRKERNSKHSKRKKTGHGVLARDTPGEGSNPGAVDQLAHRVQPTYPDHTRMPNDCRGASGERSCR